MSGSITEVRPGVWRLVVQAGHHPDGRRRQVVRKVRGDQGDAEEALATLVATHGRYRAPAPPRVRRPRPSAQRYPLASLIELTGPLSHGRVAELVGGVARSTVCSWERRGLDEYRADELAVAVGLHPALVWPRWLDVDISST